MKHNRILGFLVLLSAAALFLGCPTDSGDSANYGAGEPKGLDVTVTSGDGTVYYSLATGEKVTDPAKIASKEWDIAFQRSRMIYTNSGATAEVAGSGGQGGVWFTDKTDFDSVSDKDAVEPTGDYAEYADFTKDVVKYVATGMGPAPATASRLNVMTYVGYHGGTGTPEDPYATVPMPEGRPSADYSPYLYNKKHFVTMKNMMGSGGATFELSNQVYIIKHGDGEHSSKIQITEYTSRSADNSADPPVLAADILKIRYQNF